MCRADTVVVAREGSDHSRAGPPGRTLPKAFVSLQDAYANPTLTTLNYPSPHPIVLAIAHTYSLDNPNFSRQATARREPTLAGGRRLP